MLVSSAGELHKRWRVRLPRGAARPCQWAGIPRLNGSPTRSVARLAALANPPPAPPLQVGEKGSRSPRACVFLPHPARDRLDDAFGLLDIADLYRVDAGGLDRIVVAAGEDRVAEEQHRLARYAGRLGELADGIGLVDAFAGDVDRRRAADVDREARQHRLDDRLQRLALLCVGIPFLLHLARRLLAKRGEGDLAAAILDLLAIRLVDAQPRLGDRLVEAVEDPGAFFLAEQFGIDARPFTIIETKQFS